jgi:hypothetical protein
MSHVKVQDAERLLVHGIVLENWCTVSTSRNGGFASEGITIGESVSDVSRNVPSSEFEIDSNLFRVQAHPYREQKLGCKTDPQLFFSETSVLIEKKLLEKQS